MEMAPPASEEEVARVETELGAGLPSELPRFYTCECNGARLLWRHALDVDCASLDDVQADAALPAAEQLWVGCAVTGALLIPPLGALLLDTDRDFAGMMHFGPTDTLVRFRGEDYEEEVFKSAMRPFDNFHSFDFMCMFVDPDKARFSSHPDPRLVFASNSGASLTSSYTIPFTTYLEWVLLNCCVSATRKAALARKWTRFREECPPDLREIVLQPLELGSVAEVVDVRENVAKILREWTSSGRANSSA